MSAKCFDGEHNKQMTQLNELIQQIEKEKAA